MKHIGAVVAAACLLVGCASTPQVTYSPYQQTADKDLIAAAKDGPTLFVLPRSKLVVSHEKIASSGTKQQTNKPAGNDAPAPTPKVNGKGAPSTKKPKAAAGADTGAGTPAPAPQPDPGQVARIDNQTLYVSVLPAESSEDNPPAAYWVKPVSSFWSDTQLQIKKVPNTDIVSTLGSQVTDETKTRIQQFTSVITAVIGVAGAVGVLSFEQPSCDKAKLDDFVLPMAKVDVPQDKIPGQPCFTYSLVYNPTVPLGAVSLDSFKAAIANNAEVGFFPVPACRDVVITINKVGATTNSVSGVIRARVATPEYVRLVPLPSKGEIAMHSVCNADVTDSADSSSGKYLDDLGALMDAAKSIEDSTKNKKTQ